MSDVVNGASGADQKPSGSNGDVTVEETPPSKDSVKYETYQKVLNEKKKRDEELRLREEELATLKREKKEREEEELKKAGKLQELLELRNKENDELKQKFNGLNTTIQESVKLSSLIDSLPGALDKKYWGFVDTSGIIIDPSTNEPDPISIKRTAEKFQAEYGELIQMPGKARLPNQAASATNTAVNDEVWNSLSAKDKKDKLAEYTAYKMAKLGKN